MKAIRSSSDWVAEGVTGQPVTSENPYSYCMRDEDID